MGGWLHQRGGPQPRRCARERHRYCLGPEGRSGRQAVCPDEDASILAASAAVRPAAADIDPATVDGLGWGCTRPPFAELEPLGPEFGLGLSPQAAALMSDSTRGSRLPAPPTSLRVGPRRDHRSPMP